MLWVLVVVGLCVPVGGGPPGFRCCLLLVAPRVFRVPSGPAAREIATREPTARSRRSRSLAKLCRRPPAPRPGSAGHAGLAVPSMREPAARSRRSRSLAKPSGPSGTLHTGGAFHCCAHPIQAPPPSPTVRPLLSRSSRVALHTGGAFHCCAHPIQAPPPTGAAAKPHSQASLVPQLTRRPPHRRCLVCWWVIGVVLKPGQVLPPPTGTHRHRSQAPRASRCPQQRAVPGVLVGDRRRFKARLCPAAAHRHPPAPRPGSAGLAVPSMREPAARSRRSRSPAKPSGTLHTGGAFHCCAHPIQAPPPTGTAARLRGPRGALNKGRCLVCWWVIGVVLKPGQVLPPPTGTAVGHQPGAVCPALVSNLARWGVQH